MMTLNELVVLLAAKNTSSRTEIAKTAVGVVGDERFDQKIALKLIDKLLKDRLIYREDNLHKVSEAGQRAMLATVATLDQIRSLVRHRLFI